MSKYNSVILNIVIKSKRGIKRESNRKRWVDRGMKEEGEKEGAGKRKCVSTRCHPIAVLPLS